MNSMTFSIQTLQNPNLVQPIIFVHPTAAKQLRLPSGTLHLAFGSAFVNVQVHTHSSAVHHIFMTKKTANALMLPDGIELYGVFFRNTRTLKLAPLIGVMVSEKEINEHVNEHFGPLTAFCQEISHAARSKAALVYIFSIDSYQTDHFFIDGWLLHNNRWQNHRFPLPDIIYNRLTSRGHENQSAVQTKIKHLKRLPSRILFNDRFLDKWEVYQTLTNEPETLRFLPETRLVHGESDIKEIIQRYTTVFAKPKSGSLGQGIIRIDRVSSHKFRVQFIHKNQQSSNYYRSIKQLSQSLLPRMKGNTYIIQQGIPLVNIDRRPVDFRVLIQKNSTGIWTITSIVARIANDKSIVSNLAQGGTLVRVSEALKEIHWKTDHPPRSVHLVKTAMIVTQAIEKNISGYFAEFGIDLAVDVAGNIWLLEVNSKPSKTEDAILNTKIPVRPSVRKTIDYTLFLMGLYPKKSQKSKKANRLKKKR